MIKIYLDWNVLNQMKNGKHAELLEVLENDDRLFIPYSTSHLGDIAASVPKDNQINPHIKTDLEFLQKITGNKFLFNSGKIVMIEFRDPEEQFEEYVEQINSLKDISSDGLFGKDIFSDLPEEQSAQLKNILSTSVNGITEMMNSSDPQTEQALKMFFPGLENNPSVAGLFDSFNELLKNLNDKEGYTELRNLVQQGLQIEKDKLRDTDNPHEFINKTYERLGFANKGIESDDKNAPLWYNQISNEYLSLDMHGFHEDKVSITNRRKETFKNTTEDAFHAAFASTCHYYVTNDDKSYRKTKPVYDKLGQRTMVFKPVEFLEYFQTNLIVRDHALDLAQITEIIKSTAYYEEKLDGATLRQYPLNYFLFDFFNKVMLLIPDNQESPTLLFSRFQNPQVSTYAMEITRLSRSLLNLFGPDNDNDGEVTEEELLSPDWKGRKWRLENTGFRLVRIEGHFQLYYDL